MGTNLGVIFSVASVQRDRLEIEAAVQVDSGNDVLQRRNDAFDSSDVLLL